jgi:hypothetical protein
VLEIALERQPVALADEEVPVTAAVKTDVQPESQAIKH